MWQAVHSDCCDQWSICRPYATVESKPQILVFFFLESITNRGRTLELIKETEVLPLWTWV